MSDLTLEQKAVELITNLERLADPAMQLTLDAMRAGAIINVCLDLAFLTGIFFAWRFIVTKLYPSWKHTQNETYDVGGAIGALIFGCISAVCGIAAIFTLFSASTWLSIFAPELQLARLLIEKVTG